MRSHAGLRGWGAEMDEAQAPRPTFTGNFNSGKGSGLHKYARSSRRPAQAKAWRWRSGNYAQDWNAGGEKGLHNRTGELALDDQGQ